MRTIVTAIVSVLFSSCMHLGMMGGGASHEPSVEPVIEKEIVAEGVRATAVFPPLAIGEPVTFSLHLADASTGQPISGAQVLFHAQYLHSSGKQRMSQHKQMHEMPDSSVLLMIDQQHDINLDIDIQESASPGIYSARFTPTQTGVHRVMFHIRSNGNRTFQSELVLEASRTIPERGSGGDHGRHGMGGATPYVIIGAVVMGAMMIAFWSGGRML